MGELKPPLALLIKTETLALPRLVTAKSDLLSPPKSPAVIPKGVGTPSKE